jgi:hypothetical protein
MMTMKGSDIPRIPMVLRNAKYEMIRLFSRFVDISTPLQMVRIFYCAGYAAGVLHWGAINMNRQ